MYGIFFGTCVNAPLSWRCLQALASCWLGGDEMKPSHFQTPRTLGECQFVEGYWSPATFDKEERQFSAYILGLIVAATLTVIILMVAA
jgi:hypothetical protein